MLPQLARLSLLALALAGPANADVIGLDAVRFPSTYSDGELFNGGDHDEMRSALAGLGHELRPVTAIDSASLAELDAVFLRLPYEFEEEYTPSERQALEQFVAGGKGLVMFGPGSNSQAVNMQETMAPWGIGCGANTVNIDPFLIREWAPDPLLDMVQLAGFRHLRPTFSAAFPASDLTQRAWSQDVLTTSRRTSAEGLVVSLGTASMFADASSGTAFPLGAFDHLELLTAITAGVLSNGDCAGRRRFFGSATPGQLDVTLPRLDATCPTLGAPLTLSVDRGTPNAAGLLLVGLSETYALWFTPGSGTPAVQQWVEPTALLFHQLDGAGSASFHLQLPNDPTLEGLPVFMQAAYGPLDQLISASQPIELRAGQ